MQGGHVLDLLQAAADHAHEGLLEQVVIALGTIAVGAVGALIWVLKKGKSNGKSRRTGTIEREIAALARIEAQLKDVRKWLEAEDPTTGLKRIYNDPQSKGRAEETQRALNDVANELRQLVRILKDI